MNEILLWTSFKVGGLDGFGHEGAGIAPHPLVLPQYGGIKLGGKLFCNKIIIIINKLNKTILRNRR